MTKQALTESYILKQIERKAAACLTAFMHDMGGYTNWQPGAWKDSVAGHLIDDSKWRKKGDRPPPYCMFTRNRANGKTNWSHHDHRHDEYIAFANPRYGDGGKIWRGPLQQVQEVEVNDDGKSKVFTNFTDDPVNISYEEEVSLEHSDESHFDSEWALDVTTTASQEVGGSYLGVEAKATFEESVGVHTGGSKGGASSDTEGLSDTVSINFDLQPGEVVRVDIFKHQSRTRQDYSIDACFDFDFHFKWVHWSSSHGNAKHRGDHEYITVQGVPGCKRSSQAKTRIIRPSRATIRSAGYAMD